MIRNANLDDLEQILQINAECINDKWDVDKFITAFENNLDIFVKVNSEQRIIGYVVSLCCLDELRVINLTVSEPYQNLGYGDALLNEIINYSVINYDVRYVMLEVDTANMKAVGLYKKHNFAILCIREKYYTYPSVRDAYLMQLVV